MGSLGTYKGKEILGIAVEIRNAAGGLNEAMKLGVGAEEWDIDDERMVAMRVRAVKHRYDKVKDTDGVRLVMVCDAEDTTVIDEAIVADAIDAQAQRIEEAHGIHRMEVGKILQAAHEAGEHQKLTENCPACDAEREAVAAEG